MIAMRRKTTYPKPFNAKIVQQCPQPGVSMASVGLRHGINANLARKWIPIHCDHRTQTVSLCSMKLAYSIELVPHMSFSIEVSLGQQKLTYRRQSRNKPDQAVSTWTLEQVARWVVSQRLTDGRRRS
jgi:transposase-like protein